MAQTAPAEPTDFEAAVGDAQVTLTWDTPPTGVTGHEFRYKTANGAYPASFMTMPNSGVGGTNQKSFTVTGLTNEVEHTFQLRAVNADGESTTVETDPVTPTPGICDRTDKVQEVILAELADATECAAVNVADLASIAPSLDMSGEGISSLKEGDFAGLTSVRTLKLDNNSFTTLPAGVFTGLTALTTLRLDGDDDPQSVQGLTSLPAGVFTGLTALTTLVLRDNNLTSLPAGVFTGLTALESLELNHNNLTSLPATVFSGLTALRILTLHQNDLTSLPDGVFTGLTALQNFSLGDNPDTGNTLALTVTLEKFGTDQVRAKVPAGAPATVAFTPAVVNGALAGSATALSVLAGAVEGEAVTVERTSGTVTVDIDLTTQPSLPIRHTGYIFAKAAGSEPLEFPPPDTAPDPPTVSAIADGTSKIVVSWSAPANDGGSAITGYRLQVSNTGASGWSNLVQNTTDTSHTHTGLAAGTTRHYRVYASNAQGESQPSDVVSDMTQPGATSCTEGPDDLWCGVVTVALHTEGLFGAYGFVDASATSYTSDTGALSDETFPVGTNNYTIDSVYIPRATSDDNLTFSLTSALSNTDKEKLVLHIGSRTFAFSGVTPNASFDYRWSSGLDWSEATSITLRLRRAPDAPTNLMAEADGGTRIELTWSAPADDGGSAITGYRIEVSPDGSSGSWSDLVADTGSAATSYTHTGLSPGDTRHYRVSAINPAGTSEASGSDDATTADPPTLSSAEVDALSATPMKLDFSENLDLSRVVPASIVAAFTITADGAELEISHMLSSNFRLQVVFVAGNVIYQGQTVVVSYDKPVAGSDALADSDGDEVASFTTGVAGVPAVVNYSTQTPPLPAPTGFRAEPGDGEVTLSWDPPSSGSGVTHHDYRFKTDGSYGGWIEIDDSGPGETHASGFTVTTDIVNGTAHTFQLRAGGAGDSPAADSDEVTPMEASLDPPTNLRATAGDRQAVLTWTPPAADSGYTQHQYRYRAGDGNWERWTTIRDSGPGEANGRRATVTGLANATEYRFELRASDAGSGRSEADTTEVTPQGPPRIEGVEVVSSPGLDGDTYGAREEIRIEVTFDQPVEVVGDPRFRFDVGGSDRLAAYDSGGGTETVLFVYRVEVGDRDGDGIEVGGVALVLDGNDRIRNPAGHDAERTHDGPGRLAGHKVNGARRVGMHEHEAFTHGHGHFNAGKRYYTETYPEHEHGGHEHPDKANDHPSLNGPLKVHTHHVPENPKSVSGGPDERGHDDVEHIHRCYDDKPRCNKDDYSSKPGLPIEITHSHVGDSEPGHGYDWRAKYFEKRPPMPTEVTATAGAGRVRLAWVAPELEWDPKKLRWVVPAPGLEAHVTHHEYRYRAGSGSFTAWKTIPDSGVFGDNRDGFTVTGLDDGTAYTFELRAANAGGGGDTARAEAGMTATVPEIEGRVAVTSTPDGRYRAGDGIRIAVTFDQPVEVEGDPEFGLNVGGERVAMYRWGGGTAVLVFVYTVRPEDRDDDGIWIGNHDHDDNPTFRLDGDDRIRNAAGQDADLSHPGLGTQRGHKVNGGGAAPEDDQHSHQQFSHSHGHSKGGPPFVQVYGEHTHLYHVHHDTDDGHLSAMRPGLHVHHVQENLKGDFGPDLRSHGGMEHTHLCGDIEFDCNPDKETVQVGDELGLPIRVTHAHGDSEPMHKFDWEDYFDEAASGRSCRSRTRRRPRATTGRSGSRSGSTASRAAR